MRAAAYSANINYACVGTDSTGTGYCGRMIPTMEKPVATKTLIAVTTEASRIALLVVTDSSFWLSSSNLGIPLFRACKEGQPVPPQGHEPKRR